MIPTGLTQEEVLKKRQLYGLNQLKTTKPRTVIQMFLSQFKSFMILILLLAAAVSGVLGVLHNEGLLDTFVILGIVLLNAVIGTAQEKKAQSSLDALKKLSAPKCKVVREGQVEEIPAEELVPDDVVIIETGDFVPADLRLIQAVNLKIQEAALTGESVPSEKSTTPVEGTHVPLGDRTDCAFSSGIVTYGRGMGVVTATGMQTEVGKIAGMLQNTPQTQTPMSRRLEQLGKVLGYAVLAICLVIFIVGIVYGHSWIDVLMTAISLAVAAIPEGLPAISTVVLAIGVQRMVRRNAIIRTLPSVETLGSATVICSDKTGTLTQNKMTVEQLFTLSDTSTDDLVRIAVLCTDARLTEEGTLGDPTETALLDEGLRRGWDKNALEKDYPRVAEKPFDSDRKLMSTVNRWEGRLRVLVKGGMDELLLCCTHIQDGETAVPLTDSHRQLLLQKNLEMAGRALRVLAVGYKWIDPQHTDSPWDAREMEWENHLTFIGLVGMIDPARPEAKEAVARCLSAGIRPVMITGDHKVTAWAIAQNIGIAKEGERVVTGAELEALTEEQLTEIIPRVSVFARVSPEHKVRIVSALQRNNEVVAMTGDGVNDAPALKKADIGAAMGITGTDVAKDAADVVLTDDNFATIVAAVEEGRRIYDNILKAVQFLLSTNVGEILLLFVTSLFNLGSPLLPIQILWVNLVTDSLPALAISMDPAEEDIMRRKPRRTTGGIFTKGMIWRIGYQGVLFGVVSHTGYMVGLRDGGEAMGQTMAFCSLIIAQLLHVRNLHSNRRSFFRTPLLHNPYLLGSIGLSLLFMLAVVLVPPLRTVFGFVALDNIHWYLVGALSLIPLAVVELFKLCNWNSSKDEY